MNQWPFLLSLVCLSVVARHVEEPRLTGDDMGRMLGYAEDPTILQTQWGPREVERGLMELAPTFSRLVGDDASVYEGQTMGRERHGLGRLTTRDGKDGDAARSE